MSMKLYKYKVSGYGTINNLPSDLKGKEVYIIDEDYKLSLEQMILSNLVLNKKYKEDINLLESKLNMFKAEMDSKLKLLELSITQKEMRTIETDNKQPVQFEE